MKSRKLAEDPRINPKLNIWSPFAWMVFDQNGFFLEQSNTLGGDGTPEAISRTEYTPDRHILRSSLETPDGVATWHNDYRYGPYGVIETKTFEGDDLRHWQTTDYDARGNIVEERTYTASGESLSRSAYRYDQQNRVIEWRVTGPHDEFQLHMVDRYEQAGDLAERRELNSDGQPIRIFQMKNEKLVWWWQDPNCNCSGEIGFNDPEKGVTTSYEIQPDGSLQTTVENHPGRYGNIEVDDMQRFGRTGELLEKLTFRYERDTHGNWLVRIISAWDRTTNTMIPIQEDHRTITYY